jgi:outer membrane protein OmpA-like peptidoglycan-associated protein
MARESIQVWPAFTDLMGGVAVVLLLLGAAAVDSARAERKAMQAELAEARRTMGVGRHLVDELQKTLSTKNIKATVNSYGNLEIAADLLFESGQHKIPPNRRPWAQEFGQTLISLLNDESTSRNVALILVIGHTDSEGDKLLNMGLSIRRAQELVELWLKDLLPDAEDNPMQGCKAAKLVAAGLGESRPLVENSDLAACGNRPDEKKGCRKNRRIEIRIVPKEERMREVLACP